MTTGARGFDARSGAGIEADALADFLGRRRAVRRWSEWLAVVLALPVLLTPWALAGVAAWVLWLERFSLVGCLYGGLLLATGWWLRPRRTAPVAGQGRADLPLTFGLLDRLCAETGAPLIDRLEVNQQFNAFVTTRRGKRLLGLGVLLWAALEPAEKLALLGHELGHLVNNDPARRVIVHQAMATLDRWRYLIRPDGVMSAVLWGGPYLLIGLWAEVLGG